jgi:hypothetical protein
MNPEEIQEHQAHVLHLSGKLLAAAAGASHTLLLEALITAFVAVAEKHSCCTQIAAYAAALANERLQTTIDTAAPTRPQGAPIH